MENYVIGYRGFDIQIYLEPNGDWRWRHSTLEKNIKYEGWLETKYEVYTYELWSVDTYIHDFEIV